MIEWEYIGKIKALFSKPKEDLYVDLYMKNIEGKCIFAYKTDSLGYLMINEKQYDDGPKFYYLDINNRRIVFLINII